MAPRRVGLRARREHTVRPIHPRGTSREHRLSAQKQAVLNAAYRCPECGKWITADKYMKSPHEHHERKEE